MKETLLLFTLLFSFFSPLPKADYLTDDLNKKAILENENSNPLTNNLTTTVLSDYGIEIATGMTILLDRDHRYDIESGKIYSLNKEDKTSTFATCSGTADVVSSQTGVTGASNATGATDGNYAQLYESGDVLVLDLTDELLSGATYTIRWRRGTSTSSNPSITVEESNDNSNWSAAVSSPYSFSTQTFFDQNIIASTNTRYLRFTSGNIYDVDIDAVSYTSAACVELLGPGNTTCVNTTEIGGIVFNDINDNGLNENEDRMENVTVTLYDDTGVVGSPLTTNVSGEYLFTSLTPGTTYRIEFTVPTGMEESQYNTDSKTSVQFAQPGTCDVNLGVFYPADYCQSNPDFFSVCFVEGNPLGGGTSGDGEVLLAAPTTASGVNASLLNNLSLNKETGTVWGLAYQKTTQTLFSSAFLKRHAGFGPLGIGGIYTIDYSDPTNTSVSQWLDINTLTGVDVGTDPRSYTLPANVNTGNNDAAAFDQIGKIGMGDIDISEDDKTLYVMNLNGNGELLMLDVATKTLSNKVAVPNPGCGVAGDVRPFAVKVHRGEVYIGLVCSGESSGTNDLHFYIMKLSGNSFIPVTDGDLNYTKGFVHATYANPPTVCSNWETWISNFSDLHTAGSSGAGPRICRPQPILADLEFDIDGSIVLGFMDRTGHQTGYLQYGTTGTTLNNGYTGGDILRVYNNNGTYVLENNGTTLGGGGCGANGQGPGTGEFYCGEFYSTIHEETSHGGLAIQPTTGEVLVSVMDPLTVWSGGVTWMSNTTGQATQRYQVFQTTGGDAGSFGKAAGLGDLELSCAAAPIEIGNYVWWDDDLDGLMDPSEPGIENIPLELWLDPDGNTQGNNAANGDEILVATTTTDAEGRYIFSYAGNNNGLNAESWDCASCSGNDNKVLYNETYQVRIPDWNGSGSAHPSGTSSGLSANSIIETFKNSLVSHGPYTATNPILLSPMQNQTTINDSNGYDNPGNDAAAVETGGSGANDHTYDFAFGSCTIPILTDLTNESICQGGSFTTGNVTTSVSNSIPVTYQWYNNNGTDNPTTTAIVGQTTAALTALPTTVGNYQYRVEASSTLNTTCTDNKYVTLTVHENPTVTVADVVQCTNNLETISAIASDGNDPYTYSWSGPYSSNPGDVASFPTSAAGIYTVTVTDANTCTVVNSGALIFQSPICLPSTWSIKRGGRN